MKLGELMILQSDGNSAIVIDYGQALLTQDGGWKMGEVASERDFTIGLFDPHLRAPESPQRSIRPRS
jgi:hypothetical protein